MATVYSLILGPMVYLTVGVFLAGTAGRVWRMLRSPAFGQSLAIHVPGQAGRKDMQGGISVRLLAVRDALLLPTVLRHNAPLWAVLMLFHAGLAVLFLGHLELVADIPVLRSFPHGAFTGKGAVGLTVLFCLAYLGARRLGSPVRELSVPEDYLLLALLFLTALFGAQMSWARAWFGYETMTAADYRAWLQGLLVFRPEAGLAGVAGAGHSFMLAAHVFLANVLLMVFPFSKLMHAMFTFALNAIRRGWRA